MSTANFKLNELIDNYVFVTDETEFKLKDYSEDAEQENFIFAYNRIQSGAKKNIKPLEIFELDLSSGYYDGLIIKLFLQDVNDVSPEWIFSKYFSNDDSKYYFGICKSILQRKARAEIDRINKKMLPYISQQSRFKKINLVGTFGNGEQIYEYATN